MKINRTYRSVFAAILSFCASASWADSGFTFGGYGTLGAVRAGLDAEQAQFRSSPRQDRGATRDVDFGVDSRLGLQATYKFNETFSAVGQALVSRRDGKQGVQAEWLYVQATPMQGLDLRLGRMVLPIFMLSDNRNVGYAHHWVRAPLEVYGSYALTSFDGVQARWHNSVDDVNLRVQGSAGTSKASVFPAGTDKATFKYPRLYSLAASAEKGYWTVSASKTLGKDAEMVLGGMSLLEPNGNDNFTNLGLQYDNGSLVAMGEYVTRRYSKRDGYVDTNSYYVTAGYRIGVWTPYVTYAHYTPKGEAYRALDPNNPMAFLPGEIPKGSTRAVGLRWDAYRNVAVKAQFETVRRTDMAFMNPSLTFSAAPPSVRVWSLALDFVF